MKSILLLSLSTLTLTSVFSQACKKYMDETATDSFTGESIVASEPCIFSQPTVTDARAASFLVMDNNRFFFHLSSGRSSDLVYGSDVILVFDDGEELTLQIEQMSREKVGTEYITHANCRVYYKLHVERFFTNKIVLIKLLGSRQEFDLDKGDQTRVLAGALCITETVGIDNLNFNSERNTMLTPDGSGGYFSGSSSVIRISGDVKCEFETDTLIDYKRTLKLTRQKELAGAPHKLSFQIGLDDVTLTLYLSYAVDLGNLNSQSYVMFKYADGTYKKYNYKGENVNSQNPKFPLDITLYKEEFMNKEITAIRLSYSEYFADLIVSNSTAINNFIRYCF